MKYLITGITGQVGSHAARGYLAAGHQVVGVVRRTATTNTARLQHFGILNHENLMLVSGDVTDLPSINRVVAEHKPDVVINAAASSHVGMSFSSPIENLRTTGEGCANVLEAVRHNMSKDYNPQVVQFSSSEMFGGMFSYEHYEYGVTHHDIMTKHGKDSYDFFLTLTDEPGECYQNENTPLQGNSPYACAKIYAHNMCELYRKSYKMNTISLTCFNMEGEVRGKNFVTMKIVDYIKRLKRWEHFDAHSTNALKDELITLDGAYFPKLRLGNMHSERDWTYVEDSIIAMNLLLSGRQTGMYCVCSGITRTVDDFAKEAFRQAGIDNYKDYIVIDPKFFRPCEVPMLKGRAAKLRRVTGWEPQTNFEKLVELMLTCSPDTL
jgi:GDPmannose 4,6-dehydratase